MPKSRHRKHTKRAKRPHYKSAPPVNVIEVECLRSPLGKEIWAMVTADEKLIHFGCTYDEARALADKRNGIVITDAAASRIEGFNELAVQQ